MKLVFGEFAEVVVDVLGGDFEGLVESFALGDL